MQRVVGNPVVPGAPFGASPRNPVARALGDEHLPDDIRRQLRAGLLVRKSYTYVFRSTSNIGTSEPPTALNVQTLADAHFELVQLQTDSSAFNIQILDGGATGQQLFSDRVALASVAGSGVTPFYLPVPRIFRARASIVVQAISTSGTQAFQLYMVGNLLRAASGRLPE